MTATTPSTTPPTSLGRGAAGRAATAWRALADDTRQLIAVLVMAAAALLIGWLIITATTGGIRTVEAAGVRAAVPSGWIVRPGVGEIALVATDPRQPSVRMSVSRPAGDPTDPGSVLDRRVAARSGLLTGFSVLGREPITTSDGGGEAVMFTWAATPDRQPVRSMQGREEAVRQTAGVLVATLESPTDDYDAALAAFGPFVASLEEVAP